MNDMLRRLHVQVAAKPGGETKSRRQLDRERKERNKAADPNRDAAPRMEQPAHGGCGHIFELCLQLCSRSASSALLMLLTAKLNMVSSL